MTTKAKKLSARNSTFLHNTKLYINDRIYKLILDEANANGEDAAWDYTVSNWLGGGLPKSVFFGKRYADLGDLTAALAAASTANAETAETWTPRAGDKVRVKAVVDEWLFGGEPPLVGAKGVIDGKSNRKNLWVVVIDGLKYDGFRADELAPANTPAPVETAPAAEAGYDWDNPPPKQPEITIEEARRGQWFWDEKVCPPDGSTGKPNWLIWANGGDPVYVASAATAELAAEIVNAHNNADDNAAFLDELQEKLASRDGELEALRPEIARLRRERDALKTEQKLLFAIYENVLPYVGEYELFIDTAIDEDGLSYFDFVQRYLDEEAALNSLDRLVSAYKEYAKYSPQTVPDAEIARLRRELEAVKQVWQGYMEAANEPQPPTLLEEMTQERNALLKRVDAQDAEIARLRRERDALIDCLIAAMQIGGMRYVQGNTAVAEFPAQDMLRLKFKEGAPEYHPTFAVVKSFDEV